MDAASLVEGIRPVHLMAVAVLGFVLMLAGFLTYVAEPLDAYVAVFVLGVVLLAAGYAALYFTGREASVELECEEEDEERNGFFYVLDEDYSAYLGDTKMEDLTRRE